MKSPTGTIATRSAAVHESSAEFLDGLRRSIRLFQGFRTQYDDPDGFYTMLADDTVKLVEEHAVVTGNRVLDIGGGPGYFAQAFRRAGAESVLVEPFWESMGTAGRNLGYGVIGDGRKLPFPTGAFDISFSSNVLEHVPGPEAFVDEMVRVVRPGGLVYLAFTNWLSPFGGHATAPWHYFGGEWAAKRYERKNGHPPKNRFGVDLFRLDIDDVLALVQARTDVTILDMYPRYYPHWTRPLVKVPRLREVATWNLAIVMRRHVDATTPGSSFSQADQELLDRSPTSTHA
jgi:SAM-dependent methyltransferase